MIDKLRNLIFIVTFNFSLFLLLMIGIQNSSNKKKVNFIIGETIEFPISFIIGLSFISGSLAGSLIKINFNDKKNRFL